MQRKNSRVTIVDLLLNFFLSADSHVSSGRCVSDQFPSLTQEHSKESDVMLSITLVPLPGSSMRNLQTCEIMIAFNLRLNIRMLHLILDMLTKA